MADNDERQRTVEVTLVVLPETSVMSLASVLDPMRAANRVAARPVFSWRLLSADGRPVTLTCGIEVQVAGALGDDASGDVLILLAGFNQDRHADRRFIRRLTRVASGFAVVAGVESGCWLLGRSGLLDGRSATAHWEELEDFSTAFPALTVRADRFVTDGRFWTSGGASPTLDMMLHLIRGRCGRTVALEVASVFVYDEVHAAADAQPLVSLGRLGADRPELAAAIRLMERTIDRPMTVAALARRLGCSTRKLETLFAAALGAAPGRYYLDLRLAAAQRMVRDSHTSMREIALRSGFDSLSAFSRAFKARYASSPRRYRQDARGAPTVS
ncbi:GlxA family transcriptional regulator [Rhizobium sp. TRM95111]|uniref:GlxA family transcriptional regulator n=1 Tax=Rhizobium alarense TaxID=2846851 RepID=UPI001F39F358|nr:GlxA family transcriptional regulator [Rhizobium alarense]MCF3639058.1 GlxA family transcriptional regulator [Rhizobium alarense]